MARTLPHQILFRPVRCCHDLAAAMEYDTSWHQRRQHLLQQHMYNKIPNDHRSPSDAFSGDDMHYFEVQHIPRVAGKRNGPALVISSSGR